MSASIQSYDDRLFPFMRRKGEQRHVTESSVVIPPALIITDDEGAIWTLGFDYDEAEWRSGRFEYDVVRNGRKTGEFARYIECSIDSRGQKVIRCRSDASRRWKTWNGRQFV